MSEHLFVGVEKLIGTRVVLSGYAKTGSGTTVVVTLPQSLPGNWNATFDETSGGSGTTPPTVMDYAIFLTGAPSATGVGYVSAISTSGVQTFTITGTASQWYFWQVVRITNSSVTAFPTHN